MALLDLQGMEWSDAEEHGGDSDLSVTICDVRGASSLSLTLCDID